MDNPNVGGGGKSDPEWRLIEKMVARIEQHLSPKGAIIKSPDFIPDKTDSEPREVDVSIRLTAGSVPILIVIECRNRSRLEDRAWIEQIATKLRDIGASKIVAVSSSGFSKGAKKKAARHDIELRVLRELTDRQIEEWSTDLKVEVGIIDFKLLHIEHRFNTGTPVPGLELERSALEAIRREPLKAAVLFKNNGEAVLGGRIIEQLLDDEKIMSGIDYDGPEVRRKIAVSPVNHVCHFPTNLGNTPLLGLGIGISIRRRRVTVPLVRLSSYSDVLRDDRSPLTFAEGEAVITAPGEMAQSVIVTATRKATGNVIAWD